MRTFKDFLVTEAKTAKDTYISLKKEINELMNRFENLHYNMPPLSVRKEEIWREGQGNDCINDLDWLSALQKDIAEIINQKPPVDSVFISTLDSIDKRYEKIKYYTSKILPFVEKHIKKCDSILKDYGYDHAWMDFDECKQNMEYSLKVLKKLETVEDEYKKKDKEETEIWKKLMQKCEELYKFADYVLFGYNPRQINWRKQDWIYNGKKEVDEFLDYTFKLLDKYQNSFEKNMTDNEYYLKTGDYSGNIGRY